MTALNQTTMKLRIASSILALALYGCLLSAYKYVYSPLTVAATAAQLNDTAQTYFASKFLRDGSIESLAMWVLIVALVLVWFPFKSTPKTI